MYCDHFHFRMAKTKRKYSKDALLFGLTVMVTSMTRLS